MIMGKDRQTALRKLTYSVINSGRPTQTATTAATVEVRFDGAGEVENAAAAVVPGSRRHPRRTGGRQR
jgi:hypothetical protein